MHANLRGTVPGYIVFQENKSLLSLNGDFSKGDKAGRCGEYPATDKDIP
jgi:hypothetical protein